METEQKPKEYNFLTIEDIINNIHIGNKETFLTDFKSWLDGAILPDM